ncbi:AAA family ATPase [Variovorax paradoxus]|uniref:AAA family ATPase n=1 Tax=Variovorax paradoxus TaxID=34073 RepID=UPI0009BBE115|nr:ATP-binding protein [Variovorax paradoxus]
MFDAVTVANFMRINEAVTIPLGPVTILVGENGSGKSSILKAIHWAARCAVLRDSSDRVTLERMDYAPSRDFLHLAHKARLNSEGASPRVAVELISGPDRVSISMNSTRNDAGIKVAIRGALTTTFTASSKITAYIPGLAGLSEAESLLATPVLHRRAASGEGGSVLRHILLGLAITTVAKDSIDKHEELTELGRWVGKIFPGVRFWVKFDRLRDVFIDAKFLTLDMVVGGKKLEQQWKSLEMAGTGFLQVVQIFAYLLHFKPKLLLIDEPDSHLHPGTQERLIRAVEDAAKEFPETQFLLTTHSSNLVRASSAVSQVRWMADGVLRPEKEDQVRQRMGWGALDKDLMLITEDGNLTFMKNILSQWSELARKVLLWPTFGAGSLPRGGAITKIRNELGIAVVIHRDRDFLSDEDKKAFEKKMEYDTHEVPFWMPAGSDIEASFCAPEHLEGVFGIGDAEAKILALDALALVDQNAAEKDFNTAYQSTLGGLDKDSVGMPSKRWRDLGEFGSNTIKGKKLLDAIRQAVTNKFLGTTDVAKLNGLKKITIPTIKMHEDLKKIIETAILAQKKLSPDVRKS